VATRPGPRPEHGSCFELAQSRHQQTRRHASSRTDGHTAELDDRHVRRTVVDLGRIRMNGHGRKTGRLRKLAAQVAPPTVDRRGRDIGARATAATDAPGAIAASTRASLRSSLRWRRRSTPDSTVIWVIATSLTTVQTTALALWLTSQLRPSPARCPSPDADVAQHVASAMATDTHAHGSWQRYDP
jgi:hypothetical protein